MTIAILLADDHALFRAGLRALLEQEEDLEVVAETSGGLETVQAVCERDPDVVVLDISMPGMPGPRLAEAILKQRPEQTIIALTMHEDHHYLCEMLKIGVRGYVLKKSTGPELIQALRTVQRGERYVDPELAGEALSSLVTPPSHKRASSRLDLLTPRESEVCKLLALGNTNAEIASQLFISSRTVETHRTNVMRKLGLKSRAEIVRFAIDNGMIKLD